MRRRLLAAPALVLLVLPASAPGQTSGGTATPPFSGGVEYGQATPASTPRRPARLVIRAFRVSPTRIRSGAGTARFTFRVDGGAPTVHVRISLTRRGVRTPARTIQMRRRTGQSWSRTIRLKSGELQPGAYHAGLQVADSAPRGARLRARAANRRVGVRVLAPPPPPAPKPAPPPAPPPPPAAPAASGRGGVFPVRGPYSFGYEGSRFSASRGDRLHRGQDVSAAEGTPLVAPRAGVIHHRAYQSNGAGHYVVLRGVDGRDYVFMHMRDASPLKPGTPVSAGAQIGVVGNTGGSSGPHLHFEIWPDGWYSSDESQPIDPLAQLQAWAAKR